MRFELGYYALKPDIKVIAPWREWDLTSRTKLLEFAEAHQIPSPRTSAAKRPFRWMPIFCTPPPKEKCWRIPQEADSIVYQRTISPEEAPDKATYVEIGFEKGDAVSASTAKSCRPPPAGPAERAGQSQRHRPAWIWWKTVLSA